MNDNGGGAFPVMMMVLRLDDGETIVMRPDKENTTHDDLMGLMSDPAIHVLTWAKVHTVASAKAMLAERARREGGKHEDKA